MPNDKVKRNTWTGRIERIQADPNKQWFQSVQRVLNFLNENKLTDWNGGDDDNEANRKHEINAYELILFFFSLCGAYICLKSEWDESAL